MSNKSTHPILTDLVLSAIARITYVDDVIDVLQEALGPVDPDGINRYFNDDLADRWDNADFDQRREIVLQFAAL